MRSSDNASGWDPIEVKTGLVAGEAGWLGNNDPTGGTVVSSTIAGIDLGAAQARTYETPAFTVSVNGLALVWHSIISTQVPEEQMLAARLLESSLSPSRNPVLCCWDSLELL